MKKAKMILTAALAAMTCGLCSCGIHAFGFAQENVKEDTVSLEKVSDLHIDMTSADITIRRGEENSLHYVMNESYVPEITQDGGKLTIKSPNRSGFHFSLNDKNKMEITLDQEAFDSLDITLTSGDISIDGFDIDGSISATSGDITVSDSENGGKLNLEATSGNIKILDSRFSSITKDQSSGDTEMNHVTADRIKMEATSGDLTVRNAKIGEAEIDCTSGDITLELIGNENDYNFECACTGGSVSVGNAKTSKKYQKDNGASNTIQAETTSGEISVQFLPE